MSNENTNLIDGAEKMNAIEILAADIGFGDVKVAGGNYSNGIVKLFKFPSAVAPVVQTEHFKDSRAIQMGDKTYYVGDDAMRVTSDLIQDVVEYSHLEEFLPLFLHYILRCLNCNDSTHPSVLVLGLSVAHIQNSGYFKQKAESYFKAMNWDVKVVVLPQGAGAKVAHDNYGTQFPKPPEDFTTSQNFLIADLGFNTLDVLHVTGGKITPSNVRGIANKGVVVLAARLHAHIKKLFGLDYTVKEIKGYLDDGFIKIRGKTLPLTDVINQFKKDYLMLLEQIMEAEFGKILNKCDFVLLVGGGAYIFKDHVEDDKFYRIANTHSEYYNAIGYYCHGQKMLKELNKQA